MEAARDLAESRSGCAYNEIIWHWILQFKLFGQEYLSLLFGRLLELILQNGNWLEKSNTIVLISPHPSLLRKRFFNQSLLLVNHL